MLFTRFSLKQRYRAALKLILIPVIIIFMAGILYANGGAMVCGRKIIHAGDSKHLLIARFGQPESKELVGVVHRGVACVKAEEWLYICRKHAKPKMYVIKIVGTTIVSIEWLPDIQ